MGFEDDELADSNGTIASRLHSQMQVVNKSPFSAAPSTQYKHTSMLLQFGKKIEAAKSLLCLRNSEEEEKEISGGDCGIRVRKMGGCEVAYNSVSPTAPLFKHRY